MVIVPWTCPVCGSSKWNKIGSSSSSSYSMGKGIVGTAILGPVGAVAGIGGKKHTSVEYKCDSCKYTRSYDLS